MSTNASAVATPLLAIGIIGAVTTKVPETINPLVFWGITIVISCALVILTYVCFFHSSEKVREVTRTVSGLAIVVGLIVMAVAMIPKGV